MQFKLQRYLSKWTSWGWVLCPLYSGASLHKGQVRGPLSLIQWSLGQVGSGPYTVEPLYKGQALQWSLSTRDKLFSGASLQGTSSSVEPFYKGQALQWSLSTRDRLFSGASLQGTSSLSLSLIQWSLSPQGTRWEWALYSGASLQGTSSLSLSLIQWSGASLQGTSSSVEPLYKGQALQWSLSTRHKLFVFVPYTVEPLSTRDKLGWIFCLREERGLHTHRRVPLCIMCWLWGGLRVQFIINYT